MQTQPQETTKTYKIFNSEKCYRFKPDALPAHAPNILGIYELVTFDQNQNAQVIYIGLAHQSIALHLDEHLRGAREPKVADLLQKFPNLYFDLVFCREAQSPQDWQDIYWALLRKYQPPYNDSKQTTHSNRYSSIQLTEE